MIGLLVRFNSFEICKYVDDIMAHRLHIYIYILISNISMIRLYDTQITTHLISSRGNCVKILGASLSSRKPMSQIMVDAEV